MPDNLQEKILTILKILDKETLKMVDPALDQIIREFGKDPFLLLISCLLSLRTRDTTSIPISRELFKRAKTPQQILAIPMPELEKMLYSIGFYRRKAHIIKSVSSELLERFDGKVPQNSDDLLSIKGVGQKTANAVLGYGFSIPALCVDTHVHQLANRLGWVSTKTAEQTEVELKKIIPQEYWIKTNYLLVTWGQNICLPISPWCSRCAIAPYCPRIGVKRSR